MRMLLLGSENQSGPQQHFLLTLQLHISYHLLLPETLLLPFRAESENASFREPTAPAENMQTDPYLIHHVLHTHTLHHTQTHISHTPHTNTAMPHPETSPGTPSLSSRGSEDGAVPQQVLMPSTGFLKHIKTSSLSSISFF